MTSSPLEKLRMLTDDATIKDANDKADEGPAAEPAPAQEPVSELINNAEVESWDSWNNTPGNTPNPPCRLPKIMTLDEALNWGKMEVAPANQNRGEVGPDGQYCPILAISKYPYRFMNPKSEASDRVSKAFFANNRFWKNAWNVYYLLVPESISERPLLLVPRAEVDNLLLSISNRFNIRLNIPAGSSGLVVCFEKDGSPLPRYLGMSTSREDFQTLEKAVPCVSQDFKVNDDDSILVDCDERTFQGLLGTSTPNPYEHEWMSTYNISEWASKIERAIAATKNKAKAAKEKRKQQRVQNKTDWSRQLRHAQRYFGLRATSGSNPASQDGHAGEDDSFNPEAIVSLAFDQDVVFLSLDVEVYERGHSSVTEVGVAMLDTRDLINISPGEDGKNWMELVKGRHFWIKEHAHLVNRDFVAGCPDRFEACFGKTEMVTTADMVKNLRECFQNPLLARMCPASDSITTEGSALSSKLEGDQEIPHSATPVEQTLVATSEVRKVVLVGHDIDSDVRYLNLVGFDLLRAPSVLEILDTSELYRSMRHEDNPPSVSTLLYKFGISGWNVHNAGNDAGYTLQVLIGIVVNSMAQGKERHADPVDLIAKATQEAELRIRENLEEWKLASEGEDTDGGVPISPPARLISRKEKKQKVLPGEAA